MKNLVAPRWISGHFQLVDLWLQIRDVAAINPESLAETTLPDLEFDYVDLAAVDEGTIASVLVSHRFKSAPSRARRITQEGDLLVATVRPLLDGHTRVPKQGIRQLIASTGYAVLRIKDPNERDLLWHLLTSRLVRRQFHAKVAGSSYPAIAESDVGEIWIPKFKEHLVDRVVRACNALQSSESSLNRLIAAKREQKRGLMQQLLTGKLRFPGFTEPWKTVRLGDVAEIKFSNVNKHSVEGERVVRLCNYMDVFKNRYINDQMPFMTATATEHEIQKFTLHVGDVAITKDSETPDEIGIPALIDATASDLLLGYHLALLRPNKKILEPAFLVLLLESDLIRAHFQRSAKGLTRFALSVGAVTSTPIQLPTLLEQQAIARLYRNCVIEEGLLLKQRAAFAAQRRGLMEKLLSGEIDIQDPKETAA